MEKIITGWWDGLPIWRYKTSQEKFLEVVNEVETKRKQDKLIKLHEESI